MIESQTRDEVTAAIQTQLIRELVEQYPAVMPVLASYGMDLCCGGGHTVPDAARLHGLDPAEVVDRAASAILGAPD